MSLLFRHSSKTAMLRRFLKLAIAASDFMNEVYNGGLLPELSISMLKDIISLFWDYVWETLKKKTKLAEKYKATWDMKYFFNETKNFLCRKFWAS